ncbi:GerW family sporulation protein [Halomicrococcus sp. NG-SE-24]|uniref:GerW family sporulation protein n=1 Tax=Halomicrococcus sp. NG-SE-24 TaxID=3436928 RepID=UPI003D96D76B
MDAIEQFEDLVERLRQSATVETVYGEQIEREGKTVVPVATVGYGFGGGWETEEDETGGGLGGGVRATPVGALEVTDEETRFVRLDEGSRAGAGLVLFAGLVLGFLLGRR